MRSFPSFSRLDAVKMSFLICCNLYGNGTLLVFHVFVYIVNRHWDFGLLPTTKLDICGYLKDQNLLIRYGPNFALVVYMVYVGNP